MKFIWKVFLILSGTRDNYNCFCCTGRKVRNTDPVYHPPVAKGFRHDQLPGAFSGNHSQGSDKWRHNGEQVLSHITLNFTCLLQSNYKLVFLVEPFFLKENYA